jgi:hypothetical protein
MTQEEKDLLFKELSARHPYGVKLQVRLDYGDNEHKEGTYDAEVEAITSYNIEGTYYDTNMHGMARDWTFTYEEVKPYLRPMSSMTEEEKEELLNRLPKYWNLEIDKLGDLYFDIRDASYPDVELLTDIIDWLNAHHFDYRGLIEKGLALEAPEGMYDRI